MYTIVHSDVSWESYSFEFFDLPLDVPLVREINQRYMAYVSLWIPLIWYKGVTGYREYKRYHSMGSIYHMITRRTLYYISLSSWRKIFPL